MPQDFDLHKMSICSSTECTPQRQQCKALLAQLKQSQNLLNSQFLSGQDYSTVPSSLSVSTASSSLAMSKARQQHTGILKPSSSLPQSFSANKILDFNFNNTNNSAKPEKCDIKSRDLTKVLPQGISSIPSKSSLVGDFTNYRDAPPTISRDMNYCDVTEMKQKYDTHLDSKTNTAELFNTHESFKEVPTTLESGISSSRYKLPRGDYPTSPTTQTWRQILNKHVTVPSQLSAEELRDLDNLRELNFSYSCSDGNNVENMESSKRVTPNPRYNPKTSKTTVCKDITNKPVSVSINDMASGKRNQSGGENNKSTESKDGLGSDGGSDRRKVKFFHEQLEDDGNNRKLNSFIKDTTIKPKSLLNSTAYRSLCSSKQVSIMFPKLSYFSLYFENFYAVLFITT